MNLYNWTIKEYLTLRGHKSLGYMPPGLYMTTMDLIMGLKKFTPILTEIANYKASDRAMIE